MLESSLWKLDKIGMSILRKLNAMMPLIPKVLLSPSHAQLYEYNQLHITICRFVEK